MTAKARVETDILFDGVRIMLMNSTEGGRILHTWTRSEQTFVRSGEAAITQQGREPYLVIGQDEARAIYHALAEYFGTQVSDNRLLRQDYMAERARLDRLLDKLPVVIEKPS